MATVAAETRGAVGLARLDRPDARNALSPELMEELAAVCERWDEDAEVRCIVIAGGDKWFAAGADIKAMAKRTLPEVITSPAARFWPRLAAVRTPLIAAVSGYALGGGCELALACDMIVASEEAEFGQPEILLGIIPGRRGHAAARARDGEAAGDGAGAHRAPDRRGGGALAGDRDAAGAARCLAGRGAGAGRRGRERPPLAARLAKQAVLAAEETALTAGLEHERRLYELAMATEDRVEGMNAFIEKRKPEFRGR